MEQMKKDIIDVISKYVEIDLKGLDIKITQTESGEGNGSVPALIANIPISEMKVKNS
ncbi:MAG: cell division topological specificity factor MinE, partial [Lachnoclostridium sp.]|nr:cell division topological specificity factor MinE [Lachnoclostridium sp.]